MTKVATIGAPDPGVYPSYAPRLYHSWQAASNSRLTQLKRSPAHLRAYLDTPQSDTEALIIGRATHCAILEPDQFSASFTVAEQCNARKKDGDRCGNNGAGFHSRAGWLCGIHAKGVGFDDLRTVLSPDDHAMCLAVRDAVHSHKSARGIQAPVRETELSLRWDNLETGVPCKARLDCHAPELVGGTIWDVKTTRDASRRAFERAIFSFGYYRQAAMYLDGALAVRLPAEHFVIVAVEKVAPFAVCCYRVTEGAIDAGRDELRGLLRRYADCMKRDEWPGYSDDIIDVSLPDFAWRQLDEDSLEDAA